MSEKDTIDFALRNDIPVSKLKDAKYLAFPDTPEDEEKLLEYMKALTEKELKVFKRNMTKIGIKLPLLKPKISLSDWGNFVVAIIFIVVATFLIYNVNRYGIENHTTIYVRALILLPYFVWCTYKSIKKLLEIRKYRRDEKEYYAN